MAERLATPVIRIMPQLDPAPSAKDARNPCHGSPRARCRAGKVAATLPAGPKPAEVFQSGLNDSFAPASAASYIRPPLMMLNIAMPL